MSCRENVGKPGTARGRCLRGAKKRFTVDKAQKGKQKGKKSVGKTIET